MLPKFTHIKSATKLCIQMENGVAIISTLDMRPRKMSVLPIYNRPYLPKLLFFFLISKIFRNIGWVWVFMKPSFYFYFYHIVRGYVTWHDSPNNTKLVDLIKMKSLSSKSKKRKKKKSHPIWQWHLLLVVSGTQTVSAPYLILKWNKNCSAAHAIVSLSP